MKQITRLKKVSENVMSDELNEVAPLDHECTFFVVITITSSSFYIELVHKKIILSN